MPAKLPPELHVLKGSKGLNQGSLLPESVKKRIPFAEWMDDPDNWDEKRFVQETSEFLFNVYGIGSDQYRHLLQMLADQISIYVRCKKGIKQNGIVTTFNNGKTVGANPYVSVMKDSLNKIVVLMNELGLTPKSRLASGNLEDESPLAKFMQGPLAQ